MAIECFLEVFPFVAKAKIEDFLLALKDTDKPSLRTGMIRLHNRDEIINRLLNRETLLLKKTSEQDELRRQFDTLDYEAIQRDIDEDRSTTIHRLAKPIPSLAETIKKLKSTLEGIRDLEVRKHPEKKLQDAPLTSVMLRIALSEDYANTGFVKETLLASVYSDVFHNLELEEIYQIICLGMVSDPKRKEIDYLKMAKSLESRFLTVT